MPTIKQLIAAEKWFNETRKRDVFNFADFIGLNIGQNEEYLHENWDEILIEERANYMDKIELKND